MGRRRMLAAALAAGLMLGLAGCGQGEQLNTDQLSVWVWDERQAETLSVVAEAWSQEKHIDVEIVTKSPDSYWESVEGGILPDLLWVDQDHAQDLIAQGVLECLDPFLKKDRTVRLGDYYSQLLEPYQRDGATYALPKDCSVTALWYNKSIFDSAGQAYPDETWTWEGLYQAASKLTDRENGIYGLILPLEQGRDGWYNLIYSYGGSLVSLDEEGNRVSGWGSEETGQAMALLGDLIRDCMPSQPTMAQEDTEALFQGNHAAMILQSTTGALELAQANSGGNWACTLLPYCDRNGNGVCDPGERVSVAEGDGWAISAISDSDAAAYQLLTVFCGEEGQSAQAQANQSQPSLQALTESWGESVAELAAYQTTLAQSTLAAAPVQLDGESWWDYALNHTLYTAWNDPSRMAELLREQEAYTASDLEKAGQAKADQSKSETAGDQEGAAAGADGGETES